MTCSILSLDGCLSAIGGWWVGLVPDWVWPLLPYWPWMLGAAALGIAYKLGGAPGLAVMAGAIGFTFGRRSVEQQHEHVDGPDAAPPIPTAPRVRPKQKTIFDALRDFRK